VSALTLGFFNLGPTEFVIVGVVAVLVFGRRLPEVAGQAAGVVQKVRRSLEELRRETGIDREIQNARRAVDEAVPRDVRPAHLSQKAREGLDSALRAAEIGPDDLPPVPPAKRDDGTKPPAAAAEEAAAEQAAGPADVAAPGETKSEPAPPRTGPAQAAWPED